MKTRKEREAEKQKELEALYEIREKNGVFNLCFKKKKGFKFKKSFPNLEYANYFATQYLRYCCLSCRTSGWVYKTRWRTKGVDWYGSSTYCPECRTKHIARPDSWQLFIAK